MSESGMGVMGTPCNSSFLRMSYTDIWLCKTWAWVHCIYSRIIILWAFNGFLFDSIMLGVTWCASHFGCKFYGNEPCAWNIWMACQVYLIFGSWAPHLKRKKKEEKGKIKIRKRIRLQQDILFRLSGCAFCTFRELLFKAFRVRM